MHILDNIIISMHSTCSSSVHIKVKEESAPQVHSGKATQVKQVATSSLRASRSASKSSVHKPIPVSSDQNTPVGSPSIKHKHLSLQFKHLSKASNRSDHSEALKLAPSGKVPIYNYIRTYVCTC